jgi:3-dehydroquinate synthase
MILSVASTAAQACGYDILLQRGALAQVGAIVCRPGRRCCIVTDDGVPAPYVSAVQAQLGPDTVRFTFPQGEQSKSFETYLALQRTLLREHFTRKDAIVAVGGGVVGDLAGFAAATYMRGIDFYNVPTTLLSQLDSSIGGKTAVDLDGYKNMIGAFLQPRAVVIDPEVLRTLPRRQAAAGLAEAVKMAVTSDEELFCLLEREEVLPPAKEQAGATCTVGDIENEQTLSLLEQVICRAVAIKRDVVMQDEREAGLRRVLNFGHTLGHAVESCVGLGTLYHGECVAIGMLPVCGERIRARVRSVLLRLGLPTALPLGISEDALLQGMKHDKKAADGALIAVISEQIGSFSMIRMQPEQLLVRAREQDKGDIRI